MNWTFLTEPLFLSGLTGTVAFLLSIALWKKSRRKTKPSASPWTLGLEKSRKNLVSRLQQVFEENKSSQNEMLSQLEETLIASDLGVHTTEKLLKSLQELPQSAEALDFTLLKEHLSDQIYQMLRRPSEDFEPPESPHVMMVVGVNGVGKTTSIGKLANLYRTEGNKVLLAAADTFRAGAVNQLKVWGDRFEVTTLAPQAGSDPAAVAFDAVKAGVARKMDRVIIDTAGRLHTKVNLMEELKKIKRVITKAHSKAPHEVWLVLDATQGQNALQQARQFHETLQLTGVILTKLDSTAKGGIAVAVVEELGIPIAYIGIGEKAEDLRAFDAREFVDGLLT